MVVWFLAFLVVCRPQAFVDVQQVFVVLLGQLHQGLRSFGVCSVPLLFENVRWIIVKLSDQALHFVKLAVVST